jgi:hypothetical protein
MRRSLEYRKANDKVTEMSTLSMCANHAVTKGYTENFKVEGGLLCNTTGRCYTPKEVHIDNFYRFEGESDPADNTIMYAIDAGNGVKGTLVDAYGPYADENINSFLHEIDGVHKKE